MRNARVGAMPNPSGNNTSTRRGNRVEEAKAGGRKGITIEVRNIHFTLPQVMGTWKYFRFRFNARFI